MSSTEPTVAALEPESDAALLARHGMLLLGLARESIAWRLKMTSVLPIEPTAFPPALRLRRATFVTLIEQGRLRGCVGTPLAWRTLVEDVVDNAASAAFADARFPVLKDGELGGIAIALSVLSPPEPVAAPSEVALFAALEPGVHGLLMRAGERQSLFLPQVWRQLPEPRDFLAQLKIKAGLPPDYWAPTLEFQRFTSASVGEPGSAEH